MSGNLVGDGGLPGRNPFSVEGLDSLAPYVGLPRDLQYAARFALSFASQVLPTEAEMYSDRLVGNPRVALLNRELRDVVATMFAMVVDQRVFGLQGPGYSENLQPADPEQFEDNKKLVLQMLGSLSREQVSEGVRIIREEEAKEEEAIQIYTTFDSLQSLQSNGEPWPVTEAV